jgi:hypothetical protein
MTKKKKLTLIIAAGCLLAAAVITVICIYVFLEDTPAKLFKRIERNDVESITGVSYPEGSHGELKGDDIDKFIQLMRDADYKRSDKTEHTADGARGPDFTVKLKNGEEHIIAVVSSYYADDTLYKGFISVDYGPWYECYVGELEKLYFVNSNSRYKDQYKE